jgi:GT2 family glycosyltransferase
VISAIVPTLGGAERLERNLPSVRASLAEAGDAWEVIVVDDGAGGLGPLPEGVRLLRLPATRGYGPAVNAGSGSAAGEQLLILNDDVRLERGTVRLLVEALDSEAVFAVVPRIRSSLARFGDEGGRSCAFRAGLLEIDEAPSDSQHPTLYPVGCCFLCRRADFLALGGFDDLFAPFLWEDVDLGYRAWRRGLATRHVPEAVCDHEGSATIGRRPMEERLRAWFRNWALFHLRNIQDHGLRSAMLGAFAAFALFDDRAPVLAGLADALACFAEVGRRPVEGLPDDAIVARVRPA